MNVEHGGDDVLGKRNIGSRIPAGYAEHSPPADLASHVLCFWTRAADSTDDGDGSRIHRVLPDGCVDIVIEFGAAGSVERGGSVDVSDAMGVGAMTRPLLMSGEIPELYIGVRFLPGHAMSALGIPASELTDERVAFAEISSEPNTDLEALSGFRTNEERFDAVVALVRRRLLGAIQVPLSVRVAVQRITAANGNLRVAGLAEDIGITRQQLARQFATHVGVSPKIFARVMRAQAALARADAARAAYPRQVDWSAIACDLGYYDQPHFIDDFKALTGMTPSRWTG